MKNISRNIVFIIIPIFIGCIVLFRFSLGIHRYFDVDEFAHMHWSYLLAQGSLPYKDFFLYHVPFFQFFLLPLFLLPPDSHILIGARLIASVIYIAVALLLFHVTGAITGSKRTSLLAVLILLVFPMIFDKTLEVRPDMLMVFFFLLTVAIVLGNQSISSLRALAIGTSFGFAVAVFPKILFALPSLFYLFVSGHTRMRLPAFAKRLLFLTVGVSIPFVLFLLFLIKNHVTADAIRAIFYSSVAVNTGKIPFSLLLAFSPYPLVYMPHEGPSWPWIINCFLWIASFFGLIFLLHSHKRSFIFFSLFYLGALLFLFLFPAPYLQYFLPLSPFTSLLAAYAIHQCLKQLHNANAQRALFVLISFPFIISFFQQYHARADTGNANKEQLQVIDDVLAHTTQDETIYDMVGSYVFRKDGYFICCHPYAEFAHNLNPPPSTLQDALVENKTKYIILDRTGQSLWKPKPEDLQYIVRHYLPSSFRKIYMLGIQFHCVNGNCRQTDMNNTPIEDLPVNWFSTDIDETYQIVMDPTPSNLTIDTIDIAPTQHTLFLARGNHILKASPNLKTLRLQLVSL